MVDMTGKRFGRLVVLERAGSTKSKSAAWRCKCDCGSEVIVSGIYLRRGETRSCGCLHREAARSAMLTHGASKSRLYKVWAGMKNRCYNEKASNYRYYGAKGITVCDEWKDDFEAFRRWSLENGYDEGAKAQECTIDREDNSKSYSPENCKWVNHTTQCNNQTSNRLFEHNGTTMTMAEWAREVGMKYTTLRARIRRGMPFEQAISKGTHK